MIRILFLLLLSIVFYPVSHCQTSISGKIIDKTNQPIIYAIAALMDTAQNLIKGTVSNDEGVFTFDDLRQTNYTIILSYTGYSNYISPLLQVTKGQQLDLGTITLGEPVVNLNEVEVVARRAMIEVYADKMVFNVDGSINSSGNNGLDLLGKAPGITIDPDGNISVLGKGGVRVFINGRPTHLSGSDLTAMLQSMQSDNILSIEIITNPSAKYEAEGNAGIINILLKKNVNLGLNGTYNGSYSQGKYRRFANSVSLNYRKGKVNTYSTLSQTDNHFREDFVDTKELSTGLFLDQKALGVNRKAGYNVMGGIDLSLSDKHSVGISANVLLNVIHNTQNAPTQIYQLPEKMLIQSLFSNSEDKGQSFNGNYNLNYIWKASEKTTFSTDFSLGHFDSDGEVLQPNQYFDSMGQLTAEVNNKFNTKTGIDILGGQVDHQSEFDLFNLSTGIRATQIKTDNSFQFFLSPNGEYVIDPLRSNDFSYSEQVLGGYIIGNTTLWKKVEVNGGLRVEHTTSSGQLVSEIPTENENVNRYYLNFFPNFSAAFKPSTDHSISFSYGRRITRPNYQDLNPFEKKVSEITTFKGNPFLQPQYITNYQLTLDHRLGKERLMASILFSQNEGFFAKILEIRNDRETFIIPRNMAVNNTLSLTLSYPFHITSWWEAISFGSLNQITYEGQFENADIGIDAFVYDARIQNNINLPGDVLLDVTLKYQSPWIWRGTIQITENYPVNIGLRKDFFKQQLQIRLTGNDIFRTATNYPYSGNYGGLIIDGYYGSENQRVGLSASWKFGNQNLKTGTRRKSGLNDELNRISE